VGTTSFLAFVLGQKQSRHQPVLYILKTETIKNVHGLKNLGFHV